MTLVLSRKEVSGNGNKEESIYVGGEHPTVLHAVEVRGDKARIGLDANRDIPVHRMEVVIKIIIDEIQRREEMSEPTDFECYGQQIVAEDLQELDLIEYDALVSARDAIQSSDKRFSDVQKALSDPVIYELLHGGNQPEAVAETSATSREQGCAVA